MGRSLPGMPGTISMAQSSGGLLNGSNLRCSFPSAAGEMSLKALNVGRAWPGIADHVEFVERLLTVDPHVEDPAGFAAAGHIVFAVQRLREVQPQFVNPRGEGNIVGESALAPALVNFRLARAEYRMVAGFKYAAALKIPVALPDPAQAVGVVAILAARQNPHLERVGRRGHHGRQGWPRLWRAFPPGAAPEGRRRGGADQQHHGDDGRVAQPVPSAGRHRRNHQLRRSRHRRRHCVSGSTVGGSDSATSSP